MTEKAISIRRLAEMVNGRIVGSAEKMIKGFNSLDKAGTDEISFLVKTKNIDLLETSLAGSIIVPERIDEEKLKSAILVKDPYLAVAIIHSYFIKEPFEAKGVHPRAYVEDSCDLGEEVTINPLAVVGERVRIGERVLVESGAIIGDDVIIGDDTAIMANVTIYKGCLIGSRVTIHSGTVVGSDGYGYAANERGEHIKRPQVGIVEIQDDVEIGANSCIDRAAYGITLIKSGTKIDNLVQVAHNVIIGENSLIVAQVGISGSSTLGRNVVMGGQSATAGHVNIGDRVMIAARGGVHSNLKEGVVVAGTPTIPARQWAKCCAVYNKLPELYDRVKKNSKAIDMLDGKKNDEKE